MRKFMIVVKYEKSKRVDHELQRFEFTDEYRYSAYTKSGELMIFRHFRFPVNLALRGDQPSFMQEYEPHARFAVGAWSQAFIKEED